ncbi:MAG: hypothetical protein GC129_03595 [Proteobacteria bacterium]|nr:hypothetical protein [Pseudomonadota bacterium]
MSALPPNLPDERTAQRLLDLLAQLEHSGKIARPATPAPVAVPLPSTQETHLRQENANLRRRQTEAKQRLANLITKLEQVALAGESAA